MIPKSLPADLIRGWLPVKAGQKRSCSKKRLERDDDSTKSHPALGVRYQEINGSNSDIEFRLPLTDTVDKVCDELGVAAD